jgi:hypothetical protein
VYPSGSNKVVFASKLRAFILLFVFVPIVAGAPEKEEGCVSTTKDLPLLVVSREGDLLLLAKSRLGSYADEITVSSTL